MHCIYECFKRVTHLVVYSQTTGKQKDSEQRYSPVQNTGLATGAGVGGAVIVILVVIGVFVFIRYRQYIMFVFNHFFKPVIYMYKLDLMSNRL